MTCSPPKLGSPRTEEATNSIASSRRPEIIDTVPSQKTRTKAIVHVVSAHSSAT